MRIRIKSAEVADRNIKRARDGKEFRFREQRGLVQMGDEIRSVAVSLEPDQGAYPPGDYDLLDASFYVDVNGRLQVGRLALRPVGQQPPGPRPA